MCAFVTLNKKITYLLTYLVSTRRNHGELMSCHVRVRQTGIAAVAEVVKNRHRAWCGRTDKLLDGRQTRSRHCLRMR